MATEDPWDDPHAVPLKPEKKRRGRPASEKLYTLALKKTDVGWRLYVANVPESTINNHIDERYEPDMFEMVLAKIDSLLRRKVIG